MLDSKTPTPARKYAETIVCHSGQWSSMQEKLVQPFLVSKAKISFGIVIPAHNAADTIFETVNSILSSMEKSDCIYVIENGSVDSTWSVLCENFGDDERVSIMRSNATNAAQARNIGVEQSKSHTYTAFCDADDIWHAEKLCIIRQVIVAESSEILFHPSLSLGENRCCLEGASFLSKGLPKSAKLHWDLARYANFIGTSSLVVKSNLFSDPTFLPDMRVTQDFEAWCALAYSHPSAIITYVDRVLATHFWMGGLSKSVTTRLKNVWSIMKSYTGDAPIRLRISAHIRTFMHISWWLAKTSDIKSIFAVLKSPIDYIQVRDL